MSYTGGIKRVSVLILSQFARLTSFERTVGSALVGPMPDVSADDALVDLLLAERVFRARGRMHRTTWLNIALCYNLKSEIGTARKYAAEASAQPVRTVFDRMEQHKIDKLLAQLG